MIQESVKKSVTHSSNPVYVNTLTGNSGPVAVFFISGELTGKERDPETGLYYYGARYLDPRTSRWISADPAMWEGDYIPSAPVNDQARERNHNLPGIGGIFNYVNFHVYHYGGNNPVKLIDPDGRSDDNFWNSENIINIEIVFPEDNRTFFQRLAGVDSENYQPFFRNRETGETRPVEYVTGMPPVVSTGKLNILSLFRGLSNSGRTALTVARGVDITLRSGQIGQVLIKNNQIVGFSTRVMRHTDLARSLGLDPSTVTGATILRKGSELIIAPSVSVSGASSDVLRILHNLFQ